MKKLLVVSGLVLAVFIAAISETSAQTIYSCYKKKSGAMRYVTGPGKCKKTETEISWNTTGPKGDKGDTGPAGLAGATGAQGPEGPPGVANGIQRAVYGTLYLSPIGARVYQTLSGAGFTITILTDPITQTEFASIAFDTPWPSVPTCAVTPLGHQKIAETCFWSFTSNEASTAYTSISVMCYDASAVQIWPEIFSFLCVQ